MPAVHAVTLSASGKLTIDLRAVQENYALLQQKVAPGCRVRAVVKADAYGLGAVPVVKALIKSGCDMFFVSTPAEALALRAHFTGCGIMVLNGFYASHSVDYIDQNLVPVLGRILELEGD
jgi:alanine racemase